MNIAIQTTHLRRAAAYCAAVVGRNSSMPILGYVLLRAEGGRLTVAATDLNVAAAVEVPCDGDDGAACLPGDKFAALAKGLPGETTTLAAEPDKAVVIESGRVSYSLLTMRPADFPRLPQVPAERATVDAATMAALIDATAYAVCGDEGRYHLCGALFEAGGGKLRMVATDGHRLALAEAPGEGERRAIIPHRALAAIRKVCDEAPLELALDGAWLHVRGALGDGATASLSAKAVDAEFPPYGEVIPAETTLTAWVDRGALLAAVKRIGLVASPRSHGMNLAFGPDALTVATDNPDLGTGAEAVDCECAGKARVGINGAYLLDALTAMEGRVSLGVSGELDPVVLRSEAGDRVAVVMPMRV